MRFIPIKTRAMRPPQDDIYPVFDKYLPKLRERDVLFITSKVLAIHQGRCLPMAGTDKDRLVKKEADRYIPEPVVALKKKFYLTIKDNVLIPQAGIDESNGDGYYILWPKNTNRLLKEIWQYLRRKHHIKNLGIVTTDSHTTPLHLGTMGIGVGFYGLEPLRDYRGKKDIFGRKLKFTQTNIIDALAGTAVLLMGEGNETRPLVIVRGASDLRFTGKPTMKKLAMPLQQDIYYPLLKPFRNANKKKLSKRKT